MFEEKIAALNLANAERDEHMAKPFEKRIYTVDEIQDILGIGRTSAYNLIHKNLFHCVRIGGNIRISKKSFDAWLDNQATDF